MTTFRQILLLVFLCAAFVKAHSTHLVGGEIYYTQIGSNSYQITLKVYRDCGPDNVNDTQFDTEAHIGIYNGDLLIEVLDIDISDAIITDVPITLDNPCFIVPPDLCLEEAIYQGIVSLPPTTFGYDVVYQRCCRNNSIVNIANANNSGMSIYAHIPGTMQTVADNSSPVFNNFPPVVHFVSVRNLILITVLLILMETN